MMFRLIYLISFLINLAFGDNSCSSIPFCAEFRNQEVPSSAQFQADLSQLVASDDNIITIPLSNSDGNQLNLQISLLKNNKVRVKVLEIDHQRYELIDVLESDPEVLGFEIKLQTDDTITLIPEDNNETYEVTINNGPPFEIQFYSDSTLKLTLDTSRFVIENTDESQAFHFDVNFHDAEALYGLHHHMHKLLLSETADGSSDPFRLRNSDNGGTIGSTGAMYGSVPIVYGHSANQTSGVFLHNAAQQWVDISYAEEESSTHFMVESGTFDLFVFLGPNIKEVIRQVTGLLGTAPLPQYWTLGYHQCRYSYESIDDVKYVITSMDENDFPMDSIWLDIDYTDGKRYFTWNPETYNDPVDMQNFINDTNRKLVTIIDCHIKVDENYSVYSLAKGKYFVKTPEGDDFVGVCWPGDSSWIDFLDPEARDFWASRYSYENFPQTTSTLAGTWNDMNEPSIFDAPDSENSLPGTALHVNGVQHRDVHNIYGFLQTKATYQGLYERDNGTVRPFVLTRSHFAGSQRYTAMWTGDINAQDPYLAITYSECMNANIMGHVFCGADVGGFRGDPTSTTLFMRWYQAAVWLPFYRAHSDSGTQRREPYLFEEDVQDVLRKAMRLRYRHIHVFYTLFYQHTLTGDPISRPLFYKYPDIIDRDSQILVGSDIMGAPVLNPADTTVDVIFPGDNTTVWYRADLDWSVHYGGTSETIEADINTNPYFYRGGSIIVVRDTERQSTTDMLDDPFTIHLNGNLEGVAEGYFYDDDHTSFEYVNDDYFYLRFTSNGTRFQIEKIGGNRPITLNIDHFEFHSVDSEDPSKSVTQVYSTFNGTPLRNINFNEYFLKAESFSLMLEE